MGRQTLLKQQELLVKEDKIKNFLAKQTKALEFKRNQERPPLIQKLELYRSKFIRDEKSFVLKTKSKNETKQLKELVRHVFAKYKTPDFLFNEWENSSKNVLKYDFKEWYICVATGGSLYKEITKEFLTKKETHIFLNCAHHVTAEEAIIFSIAKAECENDGIALKIAKSKMKEKFMDEYWKQNIRWFSKNIPSKVEEINDLIDYLEYKKRENGSIVQARGLANRLVKNEEKAIIKIWAKNNHLYWNA